MKEIYRDQNLMKCTLLKSILEENDIDCIIKNETVSSLAGAVPFTETWPEVWIINDADLEKATEFATEI